MIPLRTINFFRINSTIVFAMMFTSTAWALEGDPIWTKVLPQIGQQNVPQGIVAEGDDVYVVGNIIPSSTAVNSYTRIEKRNINGDVVDFVDVNPTNMGDVAGDIAIDATGVYVVMKIGGSLYPFSSDAEWRIEKRSKTDLRQVIWSTTVNPVVGGGLDGPTSITLDATGVYVGGVGGSTGGGDGQWYIAKFGLNHQNGAPPLWIQRNHTSDWTAYLKALRVGPGGRIFALGTTGAYNDTRCREEIYSSGGAYLGARVLGLCAGTANVGPDLSVASMGNGVLYAGGYSRTGGVNTARSVIEFQGQDGFPVQTYVDTTTNGVIDLSANSDSLLATVSQFPTGGFSLSTPATNWVQKINPATHQVVWSRQVSAYRPFYVFATNNAVYLAGYVTSGNPLNPQISWYVEKRSVVPQVTPPINQPPTSTIITPATNVSAVSGTTIAFSGAGTDPDGSITTYQWRDGSCTSGSILASTQSFTKNDFTAGAHVVYFRVQDDDGAWSPCDTVTVTVTAPPTAALSAGNCQISTGQSACLSPMTWNIQNATSPNLYNASKPETYSGYPSGVSSYALAYGPNVIQARDGATVLQEVTASAYCANPNASWNGSICQAPQCNDLSNNDGDTWGADYPNDPGCSSPSDTTESPNPACSNGSDSDNDGNPDATDPGCEDATGTYDPRDGNEGDEAVCRDNIDNDNDGKTDWDGNGTPANADPGCVNANDMSEFNIGTIRPR